MEFALSTYVSRLAWLRRHLLAVLLAAAYVAMTLLSVEQQRVIKAQGTLIRSLAYDSFYLNALRGRLARENRK